MCTWSGWSKLPNFVLGKSAQDQHHLPVLSSPNPTSGSPIFQHVVPFWWSAADLFGAEDCSGRGRDWHGLWHVQPVIHFSLCFLPNIKLYAILIIALKLTISRSLVHSCSKKCLDKDYREPDLNKGESVCLDRCVSKFFEVNVKVSEKMQGEANQNKAGGMFSMWSRLMVHYFNYGVWGRELVKRYDRRYGGPDSSGYSACWIRET